MNSVYEVALMNDPVLGAAEAGYDASRQAVPQARANLLPSIGMSGSTSWNERSFPPTAFTDTDPASPTFSERILTDIPDQEFNDHGWNAQLRQSVFNLSNWYTYRSSQAFARQAEWELASASQNLILRVAQAYLDVLRAQDFLDSSIAQETAVQRQLEQVQQRFDVGLVAITDVLESTAIYDNAVVQRIQADGDHDNFFNSLTTLTGRNFNELSRLSETLPVVAPEPNDVEEWVNVALSTNFGIRAADEQVVAARRTLRARRAEHLPTIDATATHSHSVTDGPAFLGGKIDIDIFALEMSLPIYAGGFTTARAREAKALFRQAAEQLQERQWVVNRDVRNLFRSVNTDVIRVKARLKAIRSSEAALDATQTGYEVGTRNIVDVLQAQQRLYSAQFDYADSRYNYVLNMLALKQVAGTLSEQDLADLNAFMDAANPVTRLASARARSLPAGR